VGEERALELRENYGRTPTSVTWTVSDPAVLTVETSPTPSLHALAVGTATVTASANGLSAQMTVTVVGETVVLDPGAVYWAVSAQPGWTLDHVIYTHQTEPDVPEAVLVETQGDQLLLRGIGPAGTTASITSVVPVGTPQNHLTIRPGRWATRSAESSWRTKRLSSAWP
jgi:hypothetical protein